MVEERINLVADERADTYYTCCRKYSTLLEPSALIKVAFIASVLLVCIVVIPIVVYVFTGCKQAGKVGSNGRQVCTTPACVQTSAYILSNINLSADPCEDMYQYSCGGWMDKVILPPYKREISKFSETVENNMQIMKKIIESEGNVYKGVNSSAITKLKTFYRSCIDQETIEKLGISPVLKLIDKLGSWNVTSNGLIEWNRKNWTLQKSLANMHMLDTTSLFYFGVVVDAKNVTRNIIRFSQSGLTLAHKDEYTSSTKFRDAFLAFAVKVGVLLGGDDNHVTKKMTQVFEFETRLAEITVPSENLTNPLVTYNKMTIEDFQKLLGSWIDVKQYLSDNFYGKVFSGKDQIIVETPGYFQKLGKVIEGTDKEVLANYMMWNMLQSMVGYFPDQLYTAVLTLTKVESGITSLSDRWKKCLGEAKDSLGFASSALFVQEKFSSESKSKVENVLREVKYQFVINLDDVSWLDEVTKKQLKDKARFMALNVGFPDWIIDPVKLDKRYENLQVNDGEFLLNKLWSIEYFTNRSIEKYGKAPDREEWTMYPETVNAFYNSQKNSIFVPAGILQAPLYTPSLPESVIYGSVGTIIGHEMTHGFDSKGRYYDKHGNLTDIWSQSSAKDFQKNSQCVVDQYNAYTLQTKHLNGVLTLAENIADSGGLTFAFKAYKAAEKISDTVLPGLDLTDDQLFFVGFSQVWCARYKPEFELTSISTDEHSNKAFRVIGSLSNSEDFAKAFNCDRKSRMNPKNKCNVW